MSLKQNNPKKYYDGFLRDMSDAISEVYKKYNFQEDEENQADKEDLMNVIKWMEDHYFFDDYDEEEYDEIESACGYGKSKKKKKAVKSSINYNDVMNSLSRLYLGWGITDDEEYEGYGFWDRDRECVFRLDDDWVDFDYNNKILKIKPGNQDCADLFEEFLEFPSKVVYNRGLTFHLKSVGRPVVGNIKSFDYSDLDITSSCKNIKSARFIIEDEYGEVIASADTYEEAETVGGVKIIDTQSQGY